MAEKVFSVEQFAAVARQAVAEGAVLLKNDRDALPLPVGARIAVFGRSQFNYYKSGTGSGGLVNTKYVVSIRDALLADPRFTVDPVVDAVYTEWLKVHPFQAGQGWADEPWFQEEMPLDAAAVQAAADRNDAAVIMIGRTAGEDQDNKAEPGSYLLTPAEEAMLHTVCAAFSKTIVLLNVGNTMDMKWVQREDPAAVLYVWQGGQEGGNGVVDVLSGDVTPCGKLADTIARNIEDYPSTQNHGDPDRNIYAEDIYVGYRYFETFAKDRVLYPFGFGLSYTTFAVEATQMEETARGVSLCVRVANTGHVPGKEVVQVYAEAPQGALGKPARVLCAFAKTGVLAPGEKVTLTLEADWSALASFDDSGATGHKNCTVLEPGAYRLYVGGDVRAAAFAGQVMVEELRVLEQLEEAMAPTVAFRRLRPGAGGSPAWEDVPLRTKDPVERRRERLPEALPCTGDRGYKLWDVETGRVSMENFVAQFTPEDLCAIVRGEGMSSPKVTPGVAGAFGGVTDTLSAYGLPVAACSDGPSGIRMDCGNIAFAMPNGACLASTFNTDLLEELYRWEGLELRKNRIDTLLGPGINLHRSPLNGRNFEYFSEDPLLTGKLAAAQLRGMGRYGVTGTIKHFACNSQEYRRNYVEAVVSQRALRELYLKAFELAVKEGGARSIMTSYNPINGFWSASNYDLLTTVLRKEWGYTGLVMTDWWAKSNDPGQPGDVKNTAAMVRAQNDLFMVVNNAGENSLGDNSAQALEKGGLTVGELQRSAANICRFLLKTPAYRRRKGEEDELDRRLAECEEDGDSAILEVVPLTVKDAPVMVEGSVFNTAKGKTTCLLATIEKQGLYQVELTCRAAASITELAQIPVTMFKDKTLLQTLTITGAEKTWQTWTIQFPHTRKDNFFVKFYFGQSGMEVRDFRISMVKELPRDAL